MFQSSLKKCLLHAAHIHQHFPGSQIAILRYPRSKNYKTVTDLELKQLLDKEKDQGQQIVLNCTAQEFRAITQSDQYQLFPQEENANS